MMSIKHAITKRKQKPIKQEEGLKGNPRFPLEEVH